MLLLKREKEETQQIMDLCSELLQQEQKCAGERVSPRSRLCAACLHRPFEQLSPPRAAVPSADPSTSRWCAIRSAQRARAALSTPRRASAPLRVPEANCRAGCAALLCCCSAVQDISPSSLKRPRRAAEYSGVLGCHQRVREVRRAVVAGA